MEPNREQEPEVSINMQKITIQNQIMLRKKMMYNIMSKSKQYPNQFRDITCQCIRGRNLKNTFGIVHMKSTKISSSIRK